MECYAVLQYTSGSTSNPRGVVVTHANVMANFRNCAEGMGLDERSVFVSWLPVFHDMGLFGGLLVGSMRRFLIYEGRIWSGAGKQGGPFSFSSRYILIPT